MASSSVPPSTASGAPGDSVEVKQAEFEDYIETEGNKARMVLDILALDADRLERDCQWLQTKGCDITS